MFEKILVAYDGSQNANKAVGAAINLADKYNSKVCILSVVHLPDYGATVGEVNEAKTEGEERYEKALEKVLSQIDKGNLTIEQKVLFGHPANTILDYLAKEKFDLVIVGPRGISNIEKFLLGSVSSKIVHHAPCKVLIIK